MLIGSRVKELCAERNISVAKIERMAGIPEKSISKWDKNTPSFDKVQRVLDALEISYEEFTNSGSPESQKIQTALVKIRLASPAVYNEMMRKWLGSDEQKNPTTESDGNKTNVIDSLDASADQKELISEILQLPPDKVSAFLSLAKTL